MREQGDALRFLSFATEHSEGCRTGRQGLEGWSQESGVGGQGEDGIKTG